MIQLVLPISKRLSACIPVFSTARSRRQQTPPIASNECSTSRHVHLGSFQLWTYDNRDDHDGNAYADVGPACWNELEVMGVSPYVISEFYFTSFEIRTARILCFTMWVGGDFFFTVFGGISYQYLLMTNVWSINITEGSTQVWWSNRKRSIGVVLEDRWLRAREQ